MFFDTSYLLLVMIPGFVLSMGASFLTKRAFNKYSKVRTSNGMTGAQAARHLLDRAGIHDVEVVPASGFLSDHYNPLSKKLALSEPVYNQPTIAAVGVACHEAGHAIQHAKKYAPLWLRSALVPAANLGSKLGYIAMMIGLMILATGKGPTIFIAGAALFFLLVLFQLVTLPVEFDASARAKRLAVSEGIVLQQEAQGIHSVLNAAALTYVAAAVSSMLTLLYFLMRSGLLGGSRN